MSGLLELLCQIERRDKALGQSLRALLETIAEMHETDKAEIERLRKQRDEWAEKAVATAGASTLFVVPNQQFEADAKVGELVREMAPGTSLSRLFAAPRYVAATSWHKGKHSDKRNASGHDDPAEALRSIQASE